jgi:SAM-dependent methyltransferase
MADDLLWQHLKTLPAFRALLRAVEARFYPMVDLPDPILDLGCGDGNFAELTFPGRKLTAGVDPWWNPLRKAVRAGVYDTAVQAFGDHMPFPDEHFASAFSNSVLEHIPDIQPVLNETSRVMQTGGRFLITMPNHRFTECLAGAQVCERLGMKGTAVRYRRLFNKISRHAHTQPAEWWAEKLATAGFEIERWQYYFSPSALHALEIGHAQGLPSAICHALTGHWVLAPNETNLALTDKWVRPFFMEEADEDGTYLLIIARKQRTGAIPVHLPPAQPFTLAELQQPPTAKKN